MNINNKIDKYNYVSFDIFDTLVNRDVTESNKVFEVVETIYNNKNNDRISNFKINRQKAQKDFYYTNKDRCEEVTLNQIYDEMNKYYSETVCKELMNIEIESELNLCVTNKKISNVYKECINKNKKIIICSDMYLPKEIIQKILEKCGYANYFKLYVSSDLNKRKSRGSLFKFVLSDLKIKNDDIIHIGDNIVSDNIMPRTLGIDTYLIKKNTNCNFCNRNIQKNYKDSYKELENFISNHLDEKKDYFWNMGYETFGPILYGFSKWLKNSIKTDKLFFLSRDGYLMQKAFNLLDNDVDSMYFYASRRALIIPTLWMDNDIKQMVDKFYIRDYIKVGNFFRKLGLDNSDFENIIISNGYEMDQKIKYEDLFSDEKFNKLFDKIKPIIHKNSKKEYKLLLKYMKDNDFCGNVSIVDIGWNGNMQLAFNNLVISTGDKTNITGYYIGVLPESKNLGKIDMKAFLFDDKNNEDIYLALKVINSIFESMFLAPHGSVKKFDNINEEIVPVLLDYEYKDGVEKSAYESIQNGALKFIEDFEKSYLKLLLNIDSKLSFYNMHQFAYYPKMLDVEMFGNFCFLEDDIIYLAKPEKIHFYFRHPKKFLSDLYFSGWVIGFMKRLTKVNIGYSYIYKKAIKLYLNKRK